MTRELTNLLNAAKDVLDFKGSVQARFTALRTAVDALAAPPVTKPLKLLVVVYDSDNPDFEPELWVPPELREAGYSALPLNKSQELGGRYPNTDPADITLLEAGCNKGFPNYVQLP